MVFFFFKQKTAYEMRIGDWSSDVCSSDLPSVVLFGMVMAIFSMIPAVGTGLVWIPAAAWLLATGSTWEGLFVIFSGVVVIGLADNVLRPILVGRDTGIPDWIVLITTLGGIATLGLSEIGRAHV